MRPTEIIKVLKQKAGIKMALKKVAKKRVAKKSASKRAGVKTPTKKRAAKKTASVQSPVSILEKEISASQIKLGKALEKETALCEKNVAKLKTQLSKTSAKQRLQREKKKAASQNQAGKQTQAVKTKMARANDAIKATGVLVKDIRTGLQNAKSAYDQAKKAEKKFSAKEKLVAKFESDWVKAPSKKRKPVRRTRKAVAPEAVETVNEEAAS